MSATSATDRGGMTTYIGSNGILFNASADGIRYYQSRED